MPTVATISVDFANDSNFSPSSTTKALNPLMMAKYCLGSTAYSETPSYNGGFIRKTGDTATGSLFLPLSLSTDVVANASVAVHKSYVESRVSSLSSTISDSSSNGYVKISGSSMTGPLILSSSTPTLSSEAVNKAYVDSLLGNAIPAGTVISFGGSTAPAGYLACTGQTVSRATYANLFLAIGTVYGAGDGFSTFRLPDFRGEFLRGWDNGRGIDVNRAFGSSQLDDNKQHDHGTSNGARFVCSGTGGINAQVGSGSYFAALSRTGLTGTEARPRNIAILYCIKT